ncbi:MAG: type II toxin-antitoxin system RelE/ParE family toxin [Pirellulales bacterium]|nr:type II toxin-antitoxin system RelE/ParE family toxin [Pirellulales bacterium]
MDSLRSDPRPDGAARLVGSDNLYRMRVGDYRVIYSIDDANNVVDVLRYANRRKAYE